MQDLLSEKKQKVLLVWIFYDVLFQKHQHICTQQFCHVKDQLKRLEGHSVWLGTLPVAFPVYTQQGDTDWSRLTSSLCILHQRIQWKESSTPACAPPPLFRCITLITRGSLHNWNKQKSEGEGGRRAGMIGGPDSGRWGGGGLQQKLQRPTDGRLTGEDEGKLEWP